MEFELPLSHRIKEIPLEELKVYFQPKTFIEYCKACQYYNKIWMCPPYDLDVAKILEDYQYAYIIGSKLYIDDLRKDFIELLNGESLEQISNKVYKAARAFIDKRLVEMESGREHMCILLAGRCLICNPCTREKQLPCAYPEQAHFSLESIGFDVSSICEDILGDKILWAKESLPEYFIFVSAVFSEEKLSVEGICNTIARKYV